VNAEGRNIVIENNLFTQNNMLSGDRGATRIGTLGGGAGVIIRHNTWATNPSYDGNMMAFFQPMRDAILEDNIFYFSRYGIICAVGAWQACLPNFRETKNVVINNLRVVDDRAVQNIFPRSYVASKGFWAGSDPHLMEDWRLAAGSPYSAGGPRAASDGTDVGVNIAKLTAALGGETSATTPR
jgi:hypothetical protein